MDFFTVFQSVKISCDTRKALIQKGSGELHFSPKPRAEGCGFPVEISAKQKHRPGQQVRPIPSAPAKKKQSLLWLFFVFSEEDISQISEIIVNYRRNASQDASQNSSRTLMQR